MQSLIEYQLLHNKNNGEIIYIKYVSIADHEKIIISLKNQYKTYNEGNDYCSSSYFTSSILYKFINDTLIIYGGEFDKPLIDDFKTNIIFIKTDNLDFKDLYMNRKDLLFFPQKNKFLYDR